ncbi:Putative serine/threonine-protein kinase pknH [Minicystis rosea]|nr:Putative serine/threonine-protein kinase pknH [Minicystis rosea]
MGVSLANDTIFARDYKVIRPLNEGGMGAVYVVEQLSTGSQRALKLMLPQFVQDPRSRQRFEQEARVGARIESEHVVQVLAAGVDDATGYPYIVMELLKGEDLATALRRRGALSPAEVAHIFAQLCHALAAAHASGVVHRDLKPENIFLAASHREGASFTVKVLDFGIAKVVAEAKTHSTAAIGTPLWMAPEQTSAHSTVGPQTDVWALGLIAFRMLTGRIYWIAANDEHANTASLMREILFEPVIPAAARAAQFGAAASLPPGFDDWFARCVHREMSARFPNAAEARAALSSILSGFAPAPLAGGTAFGATAPVAHLAAQPPSPTVMGAPLGVSATPPQVPATAQPSLQGQPSLQAQPSLQGRPVQPSNPQMPYAAVGPQMPYGAPATTPQGVAVASKPAAAKKKGAPVALIGGGVALALVALGALGISKMRAARARSSCEQNAATATAANGADIADSCKRACNDRAGEACVLHGDLVQRLKLGDDREAIARADYDKACDAGELRGCRRGGALAERKDVAKAASLYTKACDKGDSPACSALGALHELGAGVPRDRVRAAALYDKACQAGDALGCAYKSFMLGAGRGIKQDEAKAAELAQGAGAGLGAACEHGEARECVALAVILGADKKEEGRAVQLEQQACDAGEPAGCANLGVRTVLGAGVFKDVKRGAELLKEACDAGEPSACTSAGVLSAKAAFTIRREVRGVAAFKLACDGIYSVGCSGWGLTIPPPPSSPKIRPPPSRSPRVPVTAASSWAASTWAPSTNMRWASSAIARRPPISSRRLVRAATPAAAASSAPCSPPAAASPSTAAGGSSSSIKPASGASATRARSSAISSRAASAPPRIRRKARASSRPTARLTISPWRAMPTRTPSLRAAAPRRM